MVPLALDSARTVPQHRKITAHTRLGVLRTEKDVRVRTRASESASTGVLKVHAEGHAFGSRVVGERAGERGIGTVASYEARANGSFVGVVLIWAGISILADSSSGPVFTRLVDYFAALQSHLALLKRGPAPMCLHIADHGRQFGQSCALGG